MLGAFGGAQSASAVTFVSQASTSVGEYYGLSKTVLPVRNTRGGIGKGTMILNNLMPKIEVDPETYEVHADGKLLTCEPAEVLAMAQRYFMY